MAKSYTFEALGLLHRSADDGVLNIISIASHALDAPNSFVSVLENESGQQYISASTGQLFAQADGCNMPIEKSICRYVQAARQTVAITDLLSDERTRDNSFVIESGMRTYIGSPVHTTNGKVIGALCCMSPTPREWTKHDISILERLAKCVDDIVAARSLALMESEARLKLEQIVASRNSYIAHVSHEIRTPLTGIIGSIKMLNNLKSVEQSNRMLTILNRSANKMLDFVNSVLDIAKLESSQQEMVQEKIDLGSFLQEIVGEFTALAETKSIGLKVNDQLGGKSYLAYRTAIQTIMQNLIGNAIKFTDIGTVTVSASEDSYGQVVIQVIDTGIGIAPHDHGRIFEEYKQAGDSSARSFGGTGLGMSIVKRLVDRMGGAIRVASELGQGTTIRVSIPLEACSQTPILQSEDITRLTTVAA